MFVVLLSYKVELEKVRAFLDPHLVFLDKYYAQDIFVASGPQIPSTGGVILVKGVTLERLHEIITEDPFYIEDLAEYDVTEFLPTKTGKGYEGFQVRDT